MELNKWKVTVSIDCKQNTGTIEIKGLPLYGDGENWVSLDPTINIPPGAYSEPYMRDCEDGRKEIVVGYIPFEGG
jgi:hypothetical protein